MASESKKDRELIELLNELRVVLPGVQVMFAFLLTVPFSQGWQNVTGAQKNVFFMAFMATTMATAFLIAPSTYHRIRWREHDKEQMLKTSNRFAIVGTVLLAIAMTCVVYFLTDVLFDKIVVWTTAAIAGLFSWLWFGVPLLRHVRDPDS